MGNRAIKLKRPVHLPYVDFSTPEARLAACERELELNRRTAPALYRAVHRITRGADGRLVLDGDGELVDAAVEMVRFDEASLFDRLAGDGGLTPQLMTRLAHHIAAFHAEAAVDHARGGAAAMRAVLAINEAGLNSTTVFSSAEIDELSELLKDRLEILTPILDRRAMSGKIRRCHGDLHLRNICLLDGDPVLFDCLEFSDDLATTDVLYDLAFLLMDLWHRGLERLANLVFNRYLDFVDESDGVPLLAFFMAVRAVVRAHVTATQAEAGEAGGSALRAEARSYLVLARSLLLPRPARLIAVGGLSGSGKSTVAAAVAPRVGPAPGARVLASDRIRKRLFGVAAEARLDPASYTPENAEMVYALLVRQAAHLLALGHGVVADAVFDRAADRRRIAVTAASQGIGFQGLWLSAGLKTLLARVAARRNDPSDATPEVVQAQFDRGAVPGDWTQIVADGDAETVCALAQRAVGRC